MANAYEVLVRVSEGNKPLTTWADARIMKNWISNEVLMWIGFIWLRAETACCLALVITVYNLPVP
jgi:hypothetical protein